MQIEIKKASEDLTVIDILAKSLASHYDGEDTINRVYRGVFTIPYLESSDPDTLHKASFQTYFDQAIDNQPHVFGWRFWGKTAENILFNVRKEGYEITKIKKTRAKKEVVE